MGKKKRNRNKSQNSQKKGVKNKKKFPIVHVVIVLGVVLAIGAFLYQNNEPSAGADSGITAENIETYRGGETKAVLNPARFTGKTAASYRVAEKNRDMLDYMYCYCYCAKSIGHKSLLSCFADSHAANCGICQDQAFYAANLYKENSDIAQVRKAVDRKFWKPLS
jgi:hypothetical protein